MSTICLSMIVKDESHIIKDCLESVAPLIDTWCISDTGSTDGTQDLIREFFEEKGIPGELHEDKWENFSHNRTLALDHSKGKSDYILMIDADDFIAGDFRWPKNMDKDGYELKLQRGNLEWWRIQVFKNDGSWKYIGVLHEHPGLKDGSVPNMQKIFGDYHIEARTMGARNLNQTPVEKYSKDAIMLEEALKDEPNNSRYQFYLAQSYFDSQQWEKCIPAYEKRVLMGGWEEEIYFSLYRIGLAKICLEKPLEEICMAFMQSWNYRPIRAEPLHELARYLRMKEQPRLAYLYAKQAANIKFPEWDILFVNKDVYDYAILDEIAATAFYVHEFEEGLKISKKLLTMKLPEDYYGRIKGNIALYEQHNTEFKARLKDLEARRYAELHQAREAKREALATKKKNFKQKKKVSR